MLYFSFIDCAKAFDSVDHNKLWKIFNEMGVPDHLNLSPEKPVCRSRSQQLELDVGKQTGSKFGKEYIKATYCHPAYFIYVQSISCEMPCWMKHKLESRL